MSRFHYLRLLIFGTLLSTSLLWDEPSALANDDSWKKGIRCDRGQPLAEPITIDVLVIEYNPRLPNGQTAIEFARGYEGENRVNTTDYKIKEHSEFFSAASCGRIKFNIKNIIRHDKLPVKIDGFTYPLEQWQEVVRTRKGGHEPDTVDYKIVLEENRVCDWVNHHGIDEVWINSVPWTGFYESALIYGDNTPAPFPFNGDYIKSHCNKLVSIGLPGGHTYGHRTEAILTHMFGDWKTEERRHDWDLFGNNKLQSARYSYYGCGSIHFTPSSREAYDYSNDELVDSLCDDFYFYPRLPTSTINLVSCETWGCSEKGYLAWWWNHLPMYQGKSPNGMLNDWWRYAFDPNLATKHRLGQTQNSQSQIPQRQQTRPNPKPPVRWQPDNSGQNGNQICRDHPNWAKGCGPANQCVWSCWNITYGQPICLYKGTTQRC